MVILLLLSSCRIAGFSMFDSLLLLFILFHVFFPITPRNNEPSENTVALAHLPTHRLLVRSLARSLVHSPRSDGKKSRGGRSKNRPQYRHKIEKLCVRFAFEPSRDVLFVSLCLSLSLSVSPSSPLPPFFHLPTLCLNKVYLQQPLRPSPPSTLRSPQWRRDTTTRPTPCLPTH